MAKILLIEDDPSIVRGLTDNLEFEGHSVTVAGVVEAFRNYYAKEGYTFEFTHDADSVLHRVDAEGLEQVIFNLLDNAVKYARPDGRHIEVNLQTNAGHPRLVVKDQAVPIPPEQHQKIFEKFHRVGDSLTQAVQGSGLGLALVKETVEAHQGRVTVESHSGQGNVLSVEF